MKNSIPFLFLLLLAISTNSLFAQTIGVRGGLNWATFNNNVFEEVSGLEKGFIIGADVAVFMNVDIGNSLSVQPELHWLQKGTESSVNLADDTYVILKYKYDFLELPVLLRLDFGGESAGVNFFAGPSVGFALNKTYSGENLGALDSHWPGEGDFEEDVDWDKEYGADGIKDNRFDFSAVGGLGAYLAVGEVQLVFDARYSHDFTNIVKYEKEPDPSPDKYYNQGISVTAGIAVPIGNR